MTAATRTPVSRAWPARILAGVSALGLALVLTQGVLAGHMLTGQATALALHGVMGTEVLLSLAFAQVLVAILWRARHGPTSPIITSAVLFALVFAQSMLGYDGRLALHVPNALLILLGQLWLTRQALDRRTGAHHPQPQS